MTTTDARHILDATGDDAATINGWSDRYPATIVKRTAKTIWVQMDETHNMSSKANRDSGLSFAQGHGDVTIFIRNYDAPIKQYSLRKDGRWLEKGASVRSRGGSLTLGHRSHYRDPSF